MYAFPDDTAMDRSGSGQLNFAELSHMLWRLRQEVTLRESRAEAVNTMLLLDTDSERWDAILELIAELSQAL